MFRIASCTVSHTDGYGKSTRKIAWTSQAIRWTFLLGVVVSLSGCIVVKKVRYEPKPEQTTFQATASDIGIQGSNPGASVGASEGTANIILVSDASGKSASDGKRSFGLLPQTKGTYPGFHAYTMGHAKEQNPPDRIGGPLTVTITQTNGGTRLVLPGPRFLDPAVFGTPDNPVGFDPAPFPLMGIPLEMRRVVDGKYTFVDHPTPFSDWREVAVGSIRQVTVDVTAIDGARTKDKIDLEATFTLPGPDPDEPDVGAVRYRVVCKEPLPHGSGFPTFGGVVTNHLLHGVTGLGTRLMPTEWTYVAIWGKGDIYKNDKLIAKDHMIHTMMTEAVRGEGYKLRFDGEVGQPSTTTTLHLMIPPYKPTPEGMVKSPLKTMFVPFPYIKRHIMKDIEEAKKLPPGEREERLARIEEIKELMEWTKKSIVEETIAGNMAGMPFIHIMFGNAEMKASH